MQFLFLNIEAINDTKTNQYREDYTKRKDS